VAHTGEVVVELWKDCSGQRRAAPGLAALALKAELKGSLQLRVLQRKVLMGMP